MATNGSYEREPITSVRRRNPCSSPCCRNVVTFLLCLATYCCCNMTFSMFTPFFPIEAEEKGALPIIVGAISATYPACVVVLSPLCGFYLPKIGMKFCLLTGIVLVGGSTVLFALLSLLSGIHFIVFSFLLALVGGIGSSMLQTSVYSIVGILFPNHYGLVMGLTEVMVGLGYAAGPALAGALYEIGGFKLPFLVMGSIPLTFIPILYITVNLSSSDQLSNQTTKQRFLHSFGQILNSCVMICLVLSTVIGTISLSYSNPIFSPFMNKQFHLSPFQIGLICLIGATTYVVLCLVTGPLYDRLPPKPFIVAGLVVCSVGCFLIGPAPYIGKPHLWLTMVSDGILGVGASLTIAPIYPAMMGVAKSLYPDHSTETVTMLVSGIIPAAISCGELIGPLVSGALSGIMNYEECSGLIGELSLAMAVLLMVVISADWFWSARSVKQYDVTQLMVEEGEIKKNYNTLISEDIKGTLL